MVFMLIIFCLCLLVDLLFKLGFDPDDNLKYQKSFINSTTRIQKKVQKTEIKVRMKIHFNNINV